MVFFLSNKTYINHEKDKNSKYKVFMMVNTKNSKRKRQKKKKKNSNLRGTSKGRKKLQSRRTV